MESIVDPSQAQSSDPMWVRVLYRYGVPSIIAIGLVYLLAISFTGKLDAMSTTLTAHSSLTILANEAIKESESRQETYLRLLCVNTSKTDEAKNRCLTVR